MPMINRKVELKFKCTKYCVLSAVGNGNDNVIDNTSANNIIFTIKNTKLYAPIVKKDKFIGRNIKQKVRI